MGSFSDAQFYKYSRFIKDSFGINIVEAKKDILESKLKKLMTKCRVSSFDDFYAMITESKDKKAIDEFIDGITVNKTDFFRENDHFNFIKDNIGLITENNARILRDREIRVWSAGCSTGEEAYTIAIVLKESFSKMVIRILATDLDMEVLKKAIKGEYDDDVRNDINARYLIEYFKKTDSGLCVCNDIKENVTFRQFNLMDEFPFKKGFDMIFCRNVMIYFDAATQQKLLKKFYNALVPGGLLFIGHSEAVTSMRHSYRYIQPTVYMK